MRIIVLDKVWNLRFAPNMARKNGQNMGDCDPPTVKNKEIRIAASLQGEERLDVIIHEMIHAAGWHIDEPVVEDFATATAFVLWRCGYRYYEDAKPDRSPARQERIAMLVRVLLRLARWGVREDFVQQFAGDVARVLCRLGYRD